MFLGFRMLWFNCIIYFWMITWNISVVRFCFRLSWFNRLHIFIFFSQLIIFKLSLWLSSSILKTFNLYLLHHIDFHLFHYLNFILLILQNDFQSCYCFYLVIFLFILDINISLVISHFSHIILTLFYYNILFL